MTSLRLGAACALALVVACSTSANKPDAGGGTAGTNTGGSSGNGGSGGFSGETAGTFGATGGVGGCIGTRTSCDSDAGVDAAPDATTAIDASSMDAPAGAPDAPTATTDAPLGTFVMCDDHADFNGRGRCAATGKVGAVFATQTRTSAGASTTLTAIFGTTTIPAEAGCAREAFGASCAVVTCPRTTPVDTTTAAAAGVITAKANGGALATTPDAKGKYDVATLGRALWSQPKAALAFSAAGATTAMSVAMFGETFCGPVATAMTKPAGAPSALTIDRAADLALAWTPVAVGDVELFARDESAPSLVTLHCSFTGSAGQGAVPKAALAKLNAGVHEVASRLWVRKIGIGKDGTCTELTAIQTNDSSTAGTPFEGAATFQ
ncbi:MAG TPA: hypothetical protein VHJ20_05865 [Polyangia bacterium]|nr:hypothetical protein [Polyangia bacterium]